MKKNKILNSDQIQRKLQRIARELLEAHHCEKELVLVGIDGQGLEMASRLNDILKLSFDSFLRNHREIDPGSCPLFLG